MNPINRRQFLTKTATTAAGVALPCQAIGLQPRQEIIDLHQHTNYSGRNDQRLLGHQKALGVSWTVLLPAGRLYGLGANCGGNKSVRKIVVKNPRHYIHFANEIADHPECIETIEAYLKKGALGIGEQKFRVECDSKHISRIAELAEEYDVPILMHFEHGNYNTGINRFHKILEKHSKVNFIGHAQTWWGNIDKNHVQTVMYPKGKVTPSGISDRLLLDYPNMFGDLSAGSGQNALIRDEKHAVEFIKRHQDKLIFGSDCNDIIGRGPSCIGARTIEIIRRLIPNRKIQDKLFSGNARRIIRIPK
ncbi:MAG: amidohydrolase [Verrucomicrobiota bacterium]|nr:amidohydrolase [Verrucomicrobiota bacterium]